MAKAKKQIKTTEVPGKGGQTVINDKGETKQSGRGNEPGLKEKEEVKTDE